MDSVAALQARIDELTTERDRIAQECDRLRNERERYQQLYQQMLETNAKLERGLVGPKRERFHSDAQLTIQILAQVLSGDTSVDDDGLDENEDEKPKSPPKKKRRTRPPAELARVVIEVLPEFVLREGLDAYERIGEEVRETVERRVAATVVVRNVRPKFVRKDRIKNAETEVLIAPPVDLPLEGCSVGPNFLAETVTRRWEDAMPANRLQHAYEREGFDIHRSTLCRWHMKMGKKLQRLIEAMWVDAIANCEYLATDATGVLVRAPEECKRGHFWVVVAPKRHVLFGFSERHDGAAVDELIGKLGYKGYLLADAHSVYDHLFADGSIIEAGCWSHARRYFVKSLTSEPERSKEALTLIGQLFRIERTLATLPPKKRKAQRQARSKPVVDAFYDWVARQADYALDGTPLKSALTYATNQREALERFLTFGKLPIHNNDAERELRREAVGRKNWLFIANPDAGVTANTTFVTLLASCKMHGLNPQAYLRDLFILYDTWPASRVLELAPMNWKKTLEDPHAQRRLSENVFRQVALGELGPHDG